MSSEAYVAPTSNSFQSAGAGAAATSILDQAPPAAQYICGDCNGKVSLSRGDPIRCKDCGHRILYKERTKRMVQFEAR